MEGSFAFFKNEHLRKAFELRKKGDYDGALVELKKGCDEDNDGESLYVMGETLLDGGFGLKRDLQAAEVFFERSALAGCPWGMVFNNTEKEMWFRKAFDSGDLLARGWCYAQGWGAEQDYTLARECFLQACKDGNILAQTCLAEYYLGSGAEMFFWAAKAAQNGQKLYYAAKCFEKGIGVAKDEAKAFDWYFKGAKQKNSDCFYRLGNCYEKGIGCKQDIVKSAIYYVEGECVYAIPTRLVAVFDDETIRLRELFVYGRGLKKDAQLRLKVENRLGVTANAIRIFEESCRRAQNGALCFVWIFKQNCWLNRDLRGLIGEMIWESREDPYNWGVLLDWF